MLRYLHIPCRDFVSFQSANTVLLMHGFGASAENLLSLVSLFDQSRRYSWVLPLAPFPMHDQQSDAFLGYGWFPQDPDLQSQAFSGRYFSRLAEIDDEGLSDGAAAIEHVRSTLAIPYASLVIGGFSQGAVMSVEFLLRAPQACAGALLFSGALMAQERWQQTATAAADTPLLQTHGQTDEILPFQSGEALYELLQQKGMRGRFIDFDGGHVVPQQAITAVTRLLPRWFAAQKRTIATDGATR